MKAAEVFVFASIFSAYNRLMNNQSMKTLILLGGLLLATTSAKAEVQYDQSSFWFGFVAGAGGTVCQLATGGLLSKNDAATYMEGVMETAETDPDLTEFKQDFLNAYQALKENPDCKGIFK